MAKEKPKRRTVTAEIECMDEKCGECPHGVPSAFWADGAYECRLFPTHKGWPRKLRGERRCRQCLDAEGKHD